MAHGIRQVKDWPQCLEQMSPDELYHEREYWRKIAEAAPDNSDVRRAAEKRVQDVGREILGRD
jgi:hypothetical protein